MATNLTNMLIKNEPLIEKGKATEIYDEDVTNLLIRISKTKKVFYYRYRFEGKSRKDKIGEYPYTSLKDARKEAMKIRLKLEDGIDPKQEEKVEEKTEYKFSDVVDSYFDDHVADLSKASVQLYTHTRKNLTQFEHQNIDEIDLVQISKFLKKRKKDVSAYDAINHKTLLSSIFRYAIQMGYTKYNPVRDSIQIEKPKPKSRYYTDEEIQTIFSKLEKTKQPLADIIPFIFLTGKRIGETLDLKYEMVDFEKRWIHLPSEITKNRTEDQVYMTDTVLDLIRNRQKNSDSEYIFSITKDGKEKSNRHKYKCVYHQVKVLREHSEIDDFNLHDIRRTITRLFSIMGVQQNIKDYILNNASASSHSRIRETYDVYTYNEEKKEALEKLESKLEEIISKESPELVTSE